MKKDLKHIDWIQLFLGSLEPDPDDPLSRHPSPLGLDDIQVFFDIGD